MGYDYPECIVCYCREGFNESGDSNIVSVCRECLSDIVTLRRRACDYANEMARENVLCKGCNNKGKGYIFMPFCDDHIKELMRLQKKVKG